MLPEEFEKRDRRCGCEVTLQYSLMGTNQYGKGVYRLRRIVPNIGPSYPGRDDSAEYIVAHSFWPSGHLRAYTMVSRTTAYRQAKEGRR